MTGPAPLTTPADVVRELSGSAAEADVAPYVDAVNALVPRWRTTPAGGWGPDTKLGATLLAARLYRRKDSPGGLATFGVDLNPGMVQGNWPDVAMLLGIGTYSVGRVG